MRNEISTSSMRLWKNGRSASRTGAADVARDHHLAPVPAVDERAADRREHEARQHPGDHHETDRGPRVSDTDCARTRIATQPGPVAEARRELRDEQPEEPAAQDAERRRLDRLLVGPRAG